VWIVDLGGERVLVHTDPADSAYREVRTAHRGEQLCPWGLPDLVIGVDEILG
jgi:hypothetical protein